MNTHYKTNKLFSTQLIASECKSAIFEGKLKKAILGFLFSVLFFFGFNSVAQTYNFTNAGATGRLGPSQAQLDAAYASTILSGNVTSSNGIQHWVVTLPGIYGITAAGAQGGAHGSNGQQGGFGAVMQGEFFLNAGDTLKILVGQRGENGTASYPGGGGGGSFVVEGNTPLIVAGGGSGGGNYGFNGGVITEAGGAGGGAGGVGGNGGAGGTRTGGGGGFLTNGGFPPTPAHGNPGIAFVNGGYGGAATNQCSFNASGGFGGGSSHGGNCIANGGAGGGYSGGGGGSNSASGGGGSFNSGDNQSNVANVNTGHGYVEIIAIAVSSTDIEAVSISPVTNIPQSMCIYNGYDFDVELRNNGPMVGFFVNFEITMEGMDTLTVLSFPIADLGIGETKTYRIQNSGIVVPTKSGNHQMFLRVLTEDDEMSNNIATANIVVNNLPSGSEFLPSLGFPGFPKGGDKFNPDYITYNKTYRYIISPPTAFNNNNYGTAWSASFNGLINGTPLQVSKYSYTPPSGGNNAFVDITLPESDLGAEIEIILTIMDLTVTGCDSTATRFAKVMPTPKLGFEGTFVCEGAELQFTNKSSIASGTNTYVWDFGDGNGSVLFEPKHKYQALSTYSVKLIAISDLGFSDSITLNVEVNPAPVLDYTFQNQCGALPVVFQNNSTVTTGNMTFAWDFGDGGTSDLESPIYTYHVAGPYEVTLSAETDKGCYSELKKSAYSYPTPKVDFLAPITLCAGENIIIQNSTSIEFSTWGSEWLIGSSNTRTFTESPSYIFKEFGEQPVKLKVTTQYGCVDSISKMVTVQPGPAIDLTHSNVCSNGPVTFNSGITIPDGMQVDYIWNIAGILYASSNPTVNFGSSGTKSVSVDITYANGCRNNASKEVLTGYRPEVSFSTPDVVCAGIPISLSNNTTIEFGTATHTWIMGDGSIYNDVIVPNHIYTNTTATEYTITLISSSSNGICPDTVSQNLTVGIVPVCDFNISPTYVNGHRGYTFVPTQSGSNYKWYFGDGRTSNQESPLYQYQRDGNFPVRLVVTTDEGCQCEKLINNLVVNSSANNILAESGISIYPNPSTGLVNISNEGNIQFKSIKVMNTVGAIVFDNTITNQMSEYTIDLSNVSTGVYMVTIETMDGQQFVQRVIIAK